MLQQQARALDAVQLEAARALPTTAALRATRVLLDQYVGALSRAIEQARDGVRARETLEGLLATAAFGRALVDPPRMVIAGRPNVGKSTLANALLRFERVIVHATAGTTRDAVEDLCSVRGVPFRIVDTAGIRRAASAVEREGVARGVYELAHADLAILVFDASQPLQPEDEEVLAEPMPPRVVGVLNKCDLPRQLDGCALAQRLGLEPVAMSAVRGDGLDALEDRILATAFPHTPEPGDAVVFPARQESLVVHALAAHEAGDEARCAALLDDVLHGEVDA